MNIFRPNSWKVALHLFLPLTFFFIPPPPHFNWTDLEQPLQQSEPKKPKRLTNSILQSPSYTKMRKKERKMFQLKWDFILSHLHYFAWLWLSTYPGMVSSSHQSCNKLPDYLAKFSIPNIYYCRNFPCWVIGWISNLWTFQENERDYTVRHYYILKFFFNVVISFVHL